MAVTWTGFGEELRTERERRGISIQRLCADTKVNQRFIEALERGDYQALPGGVFRRGFVRAYLKAVGLDETDWMTKFEQSYAALARSLGIAAENQEEDWATFAVNVKRNRGAPEERTLKRWLGVLILLLSLLVAVWLVWHFALQVQVQHRLAESHARHCGSEIELIGKYRVATSDTLSGAWRSAFPLEGRV